MMKLLERLFGKTPPKSDDIRTAIAAEKTKIAAAEAAITRADRDRTAALDAGDAAALKAADTAEENAKLTIRLAEHAISGLEDALPERLASEARERHFAERAEIEADAKKLTADFLARYPRLAADLSEMMERQYHALDRAWRHQEEARRIGVDVPPVFHPEMARLTKGWEASLPLMIESVSLPGVKGDDKPFWSPKVPGFRS